MKSKDVTQEFSPDISAQPRKRWWSPSPKKSCPKSVLWKTLAWYFFFMVSLIPTIFWYFWRANKTLIWHPDGLAQLDYALAYYGQWLRDLVKQWLSGNFSIPTFSLSIGYGNDLVTTLQYYVIGDPLNLLAIFVPAEHTATLHSALIILRMVLAGASMILFGWFGLRQHKTAPLVAAGVSYGFSGYLLNVSTFFAFPALPLIIFPLVLIGVERILRREGWVFFAVAVAAAGIANFYYFYQIAIFTVIYIVIRLATIMLRQKERFAWLWGRAKVLLSSAILGVGLAAVALVPIILAYSSTNRATLTYDIPLFYSPQDYVNAAISTVVPSFREWDYGFLYSGPLAGLFVLVMLLRWKKHKDLWVFAAILFAFTVLPYLGHVINGMKYVTAKGLWIVPVFFAAILLVLWDEYVELARIPRFIITTVWFAVLAYAWIKYSHIGSFEGNIQKILVAGLVGCVVILCVLLIRDVSGAKYISFALVAVIVAGQAVIGNYHYQRFAVGDYLTNERFDSLFNQFNAMDISQIPKSESALDRFEAFDARNSSMRAGVSSTQFYWSIDSTNASKWLSELGIAGQSPYIRTSISKRSILTELLSVNFEVGRDESTLTSYGFEEIDVDSPSLVTKNKNPLPLGYSYASYVDAGSPEWRDASFTQREEEMLYSVVLDGKAKHVQERWVQPTSKRLDVTSIEPGASGGVWDGKTFTTTEAGQELVFSFEPVGPGEFRIEVDGSYVSDAFDFFGISGSLTCGNEKVDLSIAPFIDDGFYETLQTGIVFNSGYCDSQARNISLRFDAPGTYTLDMHDVWFVNFDNYDESVAELKSQSLENIDVHDIGLSRATNEITGEITVDESRILVVTIPKTDGWTAYVDGKEQEILTANIMWMGLELEPGHHDIKFVYHTPGLRLGAFISIATLLGMGVAWVVRRKRRDKNA